MHKCFERNNYVSDCTGGYTDFAIEMIKNYGIPL